MSSTILYDVLFGMDNQEQILSALKGLGIDALDYAPTGCTCPVCGVAPDIAIDGMCILSLEVFATTHPAYPCSATGRARTGSSLSL